MFRRRAQRLLRGMGRPNVPPMLQRANQMMAAGDYANAAAAYKELAQDAEDSFPQRAPFLFMEAGRAYILCGQTKIGLAQLRRGLTILASQGRIARMQAFGQRAVDELKARNLNAEAEEIVGLLRVNLPKDNPYEEPVNTKRPILPTHCPACGAAVRPDEVEWLDEVTAECDYCGSPVRGNS
ncbi:MAG TPA: hypothetical protein VFI68_03365 [Anaerolineales bacterium]|nr:hypothetical protein [Anaerolineales bacterium]